MHNRPLPQSNIKPEELYERVKTSHYLSDLQKKTIQELTLAEKLLLALNFGPSQNASCDLILREIEKYDAVKLAYLNLMNTLAPSSVQSGANQEDPEDLINSSLGYLQVFSNEALFLLMSCLNYSQLMSLSKTSKLMKKMVHQYILENRQANFISTLSSEKALIFIKHFRTTVRYQTLKRKLVESPDELSDIDVASLALTIDDIKQINPQRLNEVIRACIRECDQLIANHSKEIMTINQLKNLISSLQITSLAIKFSLLGEHIEHIEAETSSINDESTIRVIRNKMALEVKETDLWKSILLVFQTRTLGPRTPELMAELDFMNLRDTHYSLRQYMCEHIKALNLSQSKIFCNLAGMIYSNYSYYSTGVNFYGCNLENANLSGAYFSLVILTHANLQNANLRSAKLVSANMENVNLENANLNGADLNDAKMNHAILIGCNLNNCCLGHSKLERANLENASLTNANLDYANLTRANLTNCDLTKCSTTQTKFEQAIFANTKFKFESLSYYDNGYYYDDNSWYPASNSFGKNLQHFFDESILASNTLEVSLLNLIQDITPDTSYNEFLTKHLKSITKFLDNLLALAKAHNYPCYTLSQRIAKVFIEKFSPIEGLGAICLQQIQKIINQIKKYSLFKKEKNFFHLSGTSKDKKPENLTGREMLVNFEKLIHEEFMKLEKLSKVENKEKRRFHF